MSLVLSQVSLRANLWTRGTILRLLMSVVSASRVNVITFQKRALKALFHHFSYSLHCSFSLRSLRLLRSSSSRKLTCFQPSTTKGMVFLLRSPLCFTVLLLRLPGTVYIHAFLCSSPFLHISSFFPPFWISRVGRGLLGVSFLFSP